MSDGRNQTPGWLPALGPQRRMTRSHAVLWTVILGTTVADVWLTIVGLGLGYEEGNAVVAGLLAAYGLPGLWLLKFAAMVWLVGGWYYLSDRNAAVFLALFAAVTTAVVVHNAAVLLGLGGIVAVG